jgi:hypothetical protein
VCDNINEKYEQLLNEVVKPLQDTVNNQAAMIQAQKGTIDKHVKKLVDHEFTITRQAERLNELENQYYDLDIRLEFSVMKTLLGLFLSLLFELYTACR